MLTILKYILKNRQLKRLKSNPSTRGFTMVELLVSTIVAFLIITPLLSFVVDILDTDVKEQSKANTEQELQSAVSYITNDLKEAVYIYDGDGTKSIAESIAEKLKGDCILEKEEEEGCIPVLVFWKQQLIEDIVPVNKTNDQVGEDHCDSNPCDDAQVYSLVAYYLITGNKGNSPWSGAARIGRLEIRDGVRNPAEYYDYLDEGGDKMELAKRDSGFQIFDISPTIAGTFEQKMEKWEPNGEITKNIEVLVDYVDHTSGSEYINETPENDTVPDDDFCEDNLGSSGNSNGNADLVGDPETYRGFFACVDSKQTLAQVYIVGNGLARSKDGAKYQENEAALFPTVTITVKGRGVLSGS
ncbi:MAG: hypothetical protein F6K54_25025 [Okeania sp. SIO3B5]|uniref:hormogonium polysaccharide secretion pseudopilin HpsC n=1 Tax=Okeania sp. SIO3B5 TaxID=2607811 RepID=UPI0013FEC0E9|nr:hormogonium polysaccharide secretion pseudopilin HpsC [Okeania sp. SIO3B5]NEO56046.1 hypothetical protein [Okeania sp. SIO3B5]